MLLDLRMSLGPRENETVGRLMASGNYIGRWPLRNHACPHSMYSKGNYLKIYVVHGMFTCGKLEIGFGCVGGSSGVQMEDFIPPEPTWAPKERVHAFAEAIAKQVSLEVGDPIVPLVARLGGHIEYRDTPSNKYPESIIVREPNEFTIFLPTMTSVERDRFTIAHELGHLFLHFPVVRKKNPHCMMMATRWVDETNDSLKRTEWEANWFAAGLLMNAVKFREAFSSYDGDIPKIAALFAVSESAADVRKQALGL
ncbi:hypothetical protein ABIB57_002985 [Devosia sp. UYZn731]|uniref:ImmA/IrrE family metallo-endopeptidase n=1 Tax=Devosia sp. UYZn731 TaxID=3156345 RepID=UPI003390CE56